MSSKYKSKHPKAMTKQSDKYIPMLYPKCTNCGKKDSMLNSQYSKCSCGGTFQFYGVK